MLFCTFTNNVNAQNEIPTKKAALARLDKCVVEPSDYDCSADNVQYLIRLYYKGEKDLLKPLLNAGLKSDEDLSETLGDFYADTLIRETESFLLVLSENKKEEQIYLIRMTFRSDGSGNTPEWESNVKAKLKKIIELNDKKLSPTAKVCAEQLEEYLAKKEN